MQPQQPPMPPNQPQAPAPPPMSWQAPEPELGPAPGVRFASPGARLLAYIVDTILIGVVFFVLFVAFTGLAIGTASDAEPSAGAIGGFLLLMLLAIVVSLAYFPWFWWRGGQTPGMKVFRIRVVRDADGGPVSGTAAVLRLLGYWVNQVVFYIGFIWILIDKRRRGWHDLIAGTVVIEV